MDEQTYSLATLLVALAILQSTGKTYVNREIEDVLKQLKIELGIN